MPHGLSRPDFNQSKQAPEFKAPTSNFTSFSGDMLKDAQTTVSRSHESGEVKIAEPVRSEEPTVLMSSKDKELTEALMAQIMDKPRSKEVPIAPEIVKKTLEQTKNPQGFWAKIWEKIRSFFNTWG